MAETDAEAGGGVTVGTGGGVAGDDPWLEAPELVATGVSSPMGTRSAFTGLGRIAALPDIGVPTGRDDPQALVPPRRPKAMHPAKALHETRRARGELGIIDRVAEPQAFV